ncbi:hypothetical protein Afil01_63430 [Actinorhabdospora filicis]|uniref:HTH cro/C1-type domain-containing protein n=1 Tax=Actinorhabdospora filicis TaxID=1785913 RepID=A0A9W6SVJ4_9ACTN|nr:helix-turn-helix transcriptional regulator [Actinorhabdospora filicis]GLZ81536.1 hypothetical protein Afil01_63430 [Actinorhabdospora filicis]
MPDHYLKPAVILSALFSRGLLTYASQAAHIGIARQTLSAVLSGRQQPQAATVRKIAESLELPYSAFVVALPVDQAD